MIVSALWIGERLSRMEQLVVRSHLRAGHAGLGGLAVFQLCYP